MPLVPLCVWAVGLSPVPGGRAVGIAWAWAPNKAIWRRLDGATLGMGTLTPLSPARITRSKGPPTRP